MPYEGDDHFKEKRGDLNSNAGGKDIHLYYTTDRKPNQTAISSISFNMTKSGAVNEYDLNAGCGSKSDYIYMHCESSAAPNWTIEKSNDGGRCIVRGYDASSGVTKGQLLAFPAIIDGAVVVSIDSKFSFKGFSGLETIFFSQAYNANKIPLVDGYFMRASLLDPAAPLKHIHIVDNSGAVVGPDELPASITSISDYGFQMTSIKSLNMPNVTSIGNGAFTGCSALTSVTMPKVTSIGKIAFFDCSALSSISLPSGLTSIGEYAFQRCSSLTSVTIPGSVTNIGSSAFDGCSKLTSVNINGNPTIGEDAFPDATSLIMQPRTNAGGDANWLTFYNDRYNFKCGSGAAKVYKATVAGGKVGLTEVEDKIVNAGTAVVLKTGSSNAYVQMNRTTATSSDTQPNDLKGVNARTYIPDMLATATYAGCTFYVLSNKDGVGFYRYSADRMPQNKAFIALPPAAAAREVLRFSDDDGTTGIDEVADGQDKKGREADTWYSLDGRRLMGKPTQKGVYVHQGRKEVIR